MHRRSAVTSTYHYHTRRDFPSDTHLPTTPDKRLHSLRRGVHIKSITRLSSTTINKSFTSIVSTHTNTHTHVLVGAIGKLSHNVFLDFTRKSRHQTPKYLWPDRGYYNRYIRRPSNCLVFNYRFFHFRRANCRKSTDSTSVRACAPNESTNENAPFHRTAVEFIIKLK